MITWCSELSYWQIVSREAFKLLQAWDSHATLSSCLTDQHNSKEQMLSLSCGLTHLHSCPVYTIWSRRTWVALSLICYNFLVRGDCASHGFSTFQCRYYIVSHKAFKLFSRLRFICCNILILRSLLPGKYDCVNLLLHSVLLKSSLSTRSGLTLLTSLV